MVFDPTKLDNTGTGLGVAPKSGSYTTTDAKATVQGAGYFNDASAAFETGDILHVVSSDADKIYSLTVDKILKTVVLSKELLFGVIT